MVVRVCVVTVVMAVGVTVVVVVIVTRAPVASYKRMGAPSLVVVAVCELGCCRGMSMVDRLAVDFDGCGKQPKRKVAWKVRCCTSASAAQACRSARSWRVLPSLSLYCLKSLMVTGAPRRRRALVASKWASSALIARGVHPALLGVVMSALRVARRRMTLAWPFCAAAWAGVNPSLFGVLTHAPN